MKKLIDIIAGRVLTVSGFVTSIVILLIIGFLFTEAVGLFSNPVVEKGYVLAVNPANTVERLNAQQIKQIFDEEITNWKDVGGSDMPVKTFRLEDLDKYYSEKELGAEYEHAGKKIAEQIHKTPGIIAFVPDVLVKDQPDVRIMPDNNISVKDVLGGNEWFPTATPSPIFGILPLISGTLWVSFFAILIALPFGLAVSIYMAEVAHFKVRKALKPIIELLNGIPSVVYGFFGLTIIVPFLQNTFNLPVGESGLAGSIVLSHNGFAHNNNSGRRRYEKLPAKHARGKPCFGSHTMADHLQGCYSVLDVGHYVGRCSGNRTRHRRDHGRADGYGQRGCHAHEHSRAVANNSGNDSRRVGRSSCWRRALPGVVPSGSNTFLHHAYN